MFRRLASSSARAMLMGAAILAVFAGPAAAHNMPNEKGEPFYSSPVTLTPPTTGFTLNSIGSQADFDLHVEQPHSVVVLGYNGEPYLRIDEEGTVFENKNSPTYYVNAEASGMGAIPATATATASPNWVFKSEGGGIEWHDHRLHWMSSEAPKVGPDGVVQNWKIDMVVDGNPVAASGQLLRHSNVPFKRYKVLVTSPASGTGFPVVPAAAVVAVVAILAAVIVSKRKK